MTIIPSKHPEELPQVELESQEIFLLVGQTLSYDFIFIDGNNSLLFFPFHFHFQSGQQSSTDLTVYLWSDLNNNSKSVTMFIVRRMHSTPFLCRIPMSAVLFLC